MTFSRITILAAVCTALFPLASSRAAESRPNILYIVADDLGWKDLGFQGCAEIKTPNI
jgi:hypothetical protein